MRIWTVLLLSMSFTTLSFADVVCPKFDCPKAPEGCSYLFPEYDLNHCVTGCGELVCKEEKPVKSKKKSSKK